MIPRANITAWRHQAPWPTNEQVEQDLVLSRVLVDIFGHETVANQAVFRGGTALHKLFFGKSGRYSEDIDLVQREAGPIGGLVDAIRAVVDPWLGKPQWKQGKGRFTLNYRFETSFAPVMSMRVKIEINTREDFPVLEITRQPFKVDNPWFQGAVALPVYHLDELLGTKLRALYQRKKGRDLYDLWLALTKTEVDKEQVVDCFLQYIANDGTSISRAQFEANLAKKLQDNAFLEDIRPLISGDIVYDPIAAARSVQSELIAMLPGESRKGSALSNR